MDSDSYTIEVDIPANTTAKVFIDKMGKGGNEVEVDGEMVSGVTDKDSKYIVIDNVGSGLHTFKRMLAH